jgi:thiamine-phosphate pyrophosphorylase
MLLYAISDRRSLPGDEKQRQRALVELAGKWARGGVDFIQIREKDLSSADLLRLAREIVAPVRSAGTGTRVLLNGPAKIAVEAAADGWHLPGYVPAGTLEEARRTFADAGREAVVSRAVHSSDEAAGAKDAALIEAATLILFAPVFEKVGAEEIKHGVGLAALAEACRRANPVPVLALGGVTAENARACIDAGAAGIAAIRLFLGEEWRGLR